MFARQRLRKDEMVALWGGEVVTWEQWLALSEREKRHSIQVEEGLFLAPTREPEPGDFLNHSCDPNAGVRGQIVLVAMRAIRPGEEICFDYAMTDGSPYDEFECRCGTRRCRGRVTGSDWTKPELQSRYRDHFSLYLQRRIREIQTPGVDGGRKPGPGVAPVGPSRRIVNGRATGTGTGPNGRGRR